jgi:hypothetical protein
MPPKRSRSSTPDKRKQLRIDAPADSGTFVDRPVICGWFKGLPRFKGRAEPVAGYTMINVCSDPRGPYSCLSPKLNDLGMVHFWDCDAAGRWRSYSAHNLENFWQFAKVWPQDLDADGNIKPEWFALRDAGWASPVGKRWPRGRPAGAGKKTGVATDPGAPKPKQKRANKRKNANKPLFCYWHGERLQYAEARKVMYIPWYEHLARQHAKYAELEARLAAGERLQLVGFDAYDFSRSTLRACLDDDSRPFGHEMVLAAMLLGERPWCD